MKTYLRFSIALLSFVLLSGCDNGSQVAGPDEAVFNKKPSKQCASNGWVTGGDAWIYGPLLIDTTVTPPDTVRLENFEDIYVSSMVIACDALYVADHTGGTSGTIMVLDLSDPHHAHIIGSLKTGYNNMQFDDLRISGSNLYARFEQCTMKWDGTTVDFCVSGTAKWNISDPFNPRLIRITWDK
jgi:hypothetical protein